MNLQQIAQIAEGQGSLTPGSRESIAQETCSIIEGGYHAFTFSNLIGMSDRDLCSAFLRTMFHWMSVSCEAIVGSVD